MTQGRTQCAELVAPRLWAIPHRRPGRPHGVLAGHFWTIAPSIQGHIFPGAAPAARPFETTLEDSAVGPVRLNGWLHDVPESDSMVLIVHGLAGGSSSPYCLTAARAAAQAGHSSLRLALRGADRSGEDISHGGLSDDLWAALASPELARYKRVFLLGYSVGGHLALRAAVEQRDARVRAVAAICPPLDLDAATIAFDKPGQDFYRRHIFAGLNRNYAACAKRHRTPTPPQAVYRARSCRERDALTVVPRFGFASAEEYYNRASAAASLHRLQTPSLVVASRYDPIIPAATLRPAIATASSALTVCWVEEGGHIHFPRDLNLGMGGTLGLEAQVIRWLEKQ